MKTLIEAVIRVRGATDMPPNVALTPEERDCYDSGWADRGEAMVTAAEVLDRSKLHSEHRPGDPHVYDIRCTVCGKPGVVRLTIDPQFDGAVPHPDCQGQCLRTFADGPKRWDAEDCPCGDAAYRPEPVAGRRQALRCRGCHHIVGRCTCLLPRSEEPHG
jgi:hypothetical protein